MKHNSFTMTIFISLFICFLLTSVSSSEKTLDEEGKKLEGISASIQYGEYAFLSGKQLSKSTQAGIGTKAGEWVMRFDNPHGKTKFSHLNFNKKFIGGKDPHIPVPDSVIGMASSVSNAAVTAGNFMYYFSVVTDGYRILSAVNEDMSGHKKSPETPKVVASVVGGNAGGYFGASVGSSVGASVGGSIGAIFGGIGAVPGAVIGSVVGGLFCGTKGAEIGSTILEYIVS